LTLLGITNAALSLGFKSTQQMPMHIQGVAKPRLALQNRRNVVSAIRYTR
jgi:hypothetical protein